MNVFVVGTGRCGTLTFSRACQHMDNFTAQHHGAIGPSDLRPQWYEGYADNHIEVNPYLSWFLPVLVESYPDALFIHLRRHKEEVVNSWVRRGKSYIPGRFPKMLGVPTDDFRRVCEIQYDVTTRNIELMADHCNLHTLWLHEIKDQWRAFWDRVGARGDFEGSLAEWDTKYNASKP